MGDISITIVAPLRPQSCLALLPPRKIAICYDLFAVVAGKFDPSSWEKAMSIHLKRAYETATEDDGYRILVDRLWPRGLSKQNAKIDLWLKEIAPSTELRQWFEHDPARWDEFRQRYSQELDSQPEAVKRLVDLVKQQPVTLIYGAKDTEFNQAVALKAYLDKQHKNPS